MVMFTMYIIFSQLMEKFYTGYCENFEIRLNQHNQERNKSTKSGIPWTLIYSRSFATRKEAMDLEIKIRKRGAKRFLLDNRLEMIFLRQIKLRITNLNLTTFATFVL
jgi:putative endonuclease